MFSQNTFINASFFPDLDFCITCANCKVVSLFDPRHWGDVVIWVFHLHELNYFPGIVIPQVHSFIQSYSKEVEGAPVNEVQILKKNITQHLASAHFILPGGGSIAQSEKSKCPPAPNMGEKPPTASMAELVGILGNTGTFMCSEQFTTGSYCKLNWGAYAAYSNHCGCLGHPVSGLRQRVYICHSFVSNLGYSSDYTGLWDCSDILGGKKLQLLTQAEVTDS